MSKFADKTIKPGRVGTCEYMNVVNHCVHVRLIFILDLVEEL